MPLDTKALSQAIRRAKTHAGIDPGDAPSRSRRALPVNALDGGPGVPRRWQNEELMAWTALKDLSESGVTYNKTMYRS